jgi:flagellar basal-body rod protein FlgB
MASWSFNEEHCMPINIEAVTTSALSAALDAATRRQAAVAANIANANSVGYTPLKVAFGEQLAEAKAAFEERRRLEPSQVDAIRGTVEEIMEGPGQPARVHLDGEMTELARNAVEFQTLAQALSRHLGMIALAAADGKR